MESIVPVWKPAGWNPLRAVRALQQKVPEYMTRTVSYAGRLDPMAEGVLILLVGDANKKRRQYEKLGKVYHAEFAWGITTDTFDPLGLITGIDLRKPSRNSVEDALPRFEGEIRQSFPPYSSKVVGKHPLFWWARRNKLSEITIPSHIVNVKKIELQKSVLLSSEEFIGECLSKIEKVEGDFRQKECIEGWMDFRRQYQNEKVAVSTFKIYCSSGTYVRALASDIGEVLGCGAIASSIIRVGVGSYTKEDCLLLS